MEAFNFDELKHDAHFWVAVSFVLFVGLFAKYVLPMILGGLDKRAKAINDQLEQANRLRAEAEALLASYQRKQEEAEKEAEGLVKQAKKDADALRKTAEVELKAAIERRTAQAEENIKRAEQDAVTQIRTQLVDIATETARQVIVAQLKDQKDDPAIARALQSIERNIH
jgi:F-type H+-transporting ATPase subunit b